jgi:serpin B
LLAGRLRLEDENVALQLPRFTIEGRFELARTLAALGMPRACAQATADFSGIDGTRELFIGEVIHQAVVAVDERGTEAAAATAVVMPRGGPPPSPPRFVADRPFAFAIHDARTDSVLFVGRLATPTAP